MLGGGEQLICSYLQAKPQIEEINMQYRPSVVYMSRSKSVCIRNKSNTGLRRLVQDKSALGL